MIHEHPGDEAPPDGGVLKDFLIGHGVTIGEGGVSPGWLKDEAGERLGWRATVDADEAAVNAAMASWAAPVDPVEAAADALLTAYAAMVAIPEPRSPEIAALVDFCVAAAAVLRPELAEAAP